jgi:hypothetical protein
MIVVGTRPLSSCVVHFKRYSPSKPVFRSYDLCLVIWINFSHLLDNSMHAHPHYIFLRLLDMGIS